MPGQRCVYAKIDQCIDRADKGEFDKLVADFAVLFGRQEQCKNSIYFLVNGIEKVFKSGEGHGVFQECCLHRLLISLARGIVFVSDDRVGVLLTKPER